MRGFSLGLIAVIAACSGDGVYIEVRVPAGMRVETVELFLATIDCNRDSLDCDGIVPPSEVNVSRPRVEGEVFFVDSPLPFVSVPDSDGSAWFHLDPSSELDLKTVVAVGRGPMLDQTGVAITKRIDLDVTQHVRIDLEPVVSQQVRGVEGPAVEVWGPPNENYRCVAAEVDDRVVYIVPEKDPDCDSLTAADGECFPDVHLGATPVSTDLLAQSCATNENGNVCRLGSRGCDESDPQPSDDNCTPSLAPMYCVPDRVCGCDEIGLDCLTAQFGNPQTGGGTHIVCAVETEIDPKGGTRSCVDKQGVGDPISMADCFTPEVAALNDGFAGFVPAMTSVPMPGVQGGVTVKPVVGAGCTITIAPPNTRFPGNPPLSTVRTLVKVLVSQPGNPVEKFMIMPLEVKFQQPESGCALGTATRCTLLPAPGENVTRCFQ